jgi:hypothetical protein
MEYSFQYFSFEKYLQKYRQKEMCVACVVLLARCRMRAVLARRNGCGAVKR